MILSRLRVTNLLDVGCDFGSLIHEVSKYGIVARGFDVNEELIDLAKTSRLDAVSCSIEDIVSLGSFKSLRLNSKEGFSAVSCLNLLHGEWENRDTPSRFLGICLEEYDYVVIIADRKFFSSISKEFDLTYALFLNPSGRPSPKFLLHLSQYGSTFFFSGKFHWLESFFGEDCLGLSGIPSPQKAIQTWL